MVFFFVIGGRWYYPWIAASVLSEFLSGCILCVFQAWRWQKFRQIRWISWESFSTNFSVAQELWKDAAPLNGKTFSSTISFSRPSIKRRYIFFDFSQLRYFPDFYVLFPIASINLESPDRDWCNCQAQCHPSVVIYSTCISPSLHIPHIFPGGRRLRGPVSIVFADSLVSSAHLLRKRVHAKRENVAKKKRTYPFPPTPSSRVSLFFPLFQLPWVFPVSLLPTQRFSARDTAGLLILIIDRGIIKVALARVTREDAFN